MCRRFVQLTVALVALACLAVCVGATYLWWKGSSLTGIPDENWDEVEVSVVGKYVAVSSGRSGLSAFLVTQWSGKPEFRFTQRTWGGPFTPEYWIWPATRQSCRVLGLNVDHGTCTPLMGSDGRPARFARPISKVLPDDVTPSAPVPFVATGNLPHLWLIIATAAPSTLWLSWLLRRRMVSRVRRPTDRCATCGYDLRASPERCPECGAEPRRAS